MFNLTMSCRIAMCLVSGLELSESREEREADKFAREVIKKA